MQLLQIEVSNTELCVFENLFRIFETPYLFILYPFVDMPQFVKTMLYGLGVFVVFTILATGLKFASNNLPIDADYFGLFTNNDLILGVVVAAVVTISHERKKRIG